MADNLEKVHAETLRGGPRGIVGDPPPDVGLETGEVMGPMPPAGEGSEEPLPLVGPIAPDANDLEDDPYNLPITHEVTLEGALDLASLLCQLYSPLSACARFPAGISKCRVSSLTGWNLHTKSVRCPLRQSVRGNCGYTDIHVKGLDTISFGFFFLHFDLSLVYQFPPTDLDFLLQG
jgi:hypothetical protein